MSEVFTDGKKKIMISDHDSISQKVKSEIFLAGMMGIAASADLPFFRRPDPPPRFKWRDEPPPSEPWRSKEASAERRRRRGKAKARKKRRGF